MGRRLIGIDAQNPGIEQDLIIRRVAADGPVDPALEAEIDDALNRLELKANEDEALSDFEKLDRELPDGQEETVIVTAPPIRKSGEVPKVEVTISNSK